MKISLGTDHAGFRYKEKIKELLISLGHEVKDFGTTSEEPVDYPKFIRPAAEAVASAASATGDCSSAAPAMAKRWRRTRSAESVARSAGTRKRRAFRASITMPTSSRSASG